ncbi:hypothetical protein [Chitinimonas naiadis]
MDKASQRRWWIWLGLLGATIAAMVYPTEEDGAAVSEVAQPNRPAAVSAVPGQPVASAASEPSAALPDMKADPFAPRGWQAPPPPPPPAPVVVAPIAPPAPVGPPPLPYRFMGRLNDGGDQVIYLSHGDQTVIARAGETLESTYKVLGIDAQRIEFEYLPTGDKQSLTIAAPEN